MGRQHSDTEAITTILNEDFGFGVEHVDLSVYKDAFARIDLNGVAAIDLRDCRGWQKHFDFFKEQLGVLQERIRTTGRAVPIINPPEMFEWVASKEYLAEFKNRGIAIVETEFLTRTAAADHWPDIFSLINKNPDVRLVLKPARGSRAEHVVFVTKRGEDAFELSAPKPFGESSSEALLTFTGEALKARLKSYAMEMWRAQQPAILIQQFCRGIEISAVLIGSRAHYVRRTAGPEGIAHDDFGGTNLPEVNPHPLVVALAMQVKEALPDELRDCPFVRVDMLKDGDNPPVLLEVEAGSARLFLIETARTNEYADMIRERIVEGRRRLRLAMSPAQRCLQS
jgi:glutathione synthase/RimK-type ligase-like ATP-grasp enzyme